MADYVITARTKHDHARSAGAGVQASMLDRRPVGRQLADSRLLQAWPPSVLGTAPADITTQLVQTTNSYGGTRERRPDEIHWSGDFYNRHIAKDLADAKKGGLWRANNGHYRGHYTFMTEDDLVNAVLALNGTYGQGAHNVVLRGAPHFHIVVDYGADKHQVSETNSITATSNVLIGFKVNVYGRIVIFHMESA